jgi:hypothetical protein
LPGIRLVERQNPDAEQDVVEFLHIADVRPGLSADLIDGRPIEGADTSSQFGIGAPQRHRPGAALL